MGFLGKLFGGGSKPSAASAKGVFIEEVVAALRETGSLELASVSEDEFTIKAKLDASGTEMSIYLGNLFAEVRECTPDERRERVQRFARGMREGDEVPPWEQAQARLAVVLRGPMLTGPQRKLARQVVRELAPCIREHVVVDRDDSLSYVTERNLEKWQVSADQVFETARGVVASVAERGVTIYDEAPSRIWSVESDDSYESSRLLVPGFLASFAAKVEGRPIAIVPERSTLLIAGDANPATVMRLCEMAEREYAASPRRISAALYTAGADGRLIEYVRDPMDEAGRRVALNRLRFHGNEYTAQKEELLAQFEADGTDVFVASFSALGGKDGAPDRSFSTWGPDVDTLLPLTDLVAVGEPGPGKPNVALVRWADLLRVAGDKLRPDPDHFPTRWRTVQQLSAPEHEALRACGI